MKYLQHLLDLFDIELYKRKDIKRIEIAYQSEGKYGMELTLHQKEVVSDCYHLAICNEGKAICRASVTWI